MEKIYFFNDTVNREINTENVKNQYYSISKYGFLTQIRKIKTVKVKEGEVIYAITVVPKRISAKMSISNWEIKREKINVGTGQEYYATVDGQHAQIALAILEAEGNKKVKDLNDYIEKVELPRTMTVSKFISLLNYGRSWTYKDFSNKSISTGNEYIDYMGQLIKTDKNQKDKYVADFIYSLYTISVNLTLNNNAVTAMKNGRSDIKASGVSLLSDNTQALGNELLQAFKDSSVGEDTFNKGKLGKGLKMFYNSLEGEEKTKETLLKVISALNKNVWETDKKPSGSPEPKDYCDNFIAVWNRINITEAPVEE